MTQEQFLKDLELNDAKVKANPKTYQEQFKNYAEFIVKNKCRVCKEDEDGTR